MLYYAVIEITVESFVSKLHGTSEKVSHNEVNVKLLSLFSVNRNTLLRSTGLVMQYKIQVKITRKVLASNGATQLNQ